MSAITAKIKRRSVVAFASSLSRCTGTACADCLSSPFSFQ